MSTGATSFGKTAGKASRWLAGTVSLILLSSQGLNLLQTYPAYAAANVCATPGKDGPVNATDIVNTYFPPIANSTLASGQTSITLDSYYTEGADTPISEGDMLMIIQMQDATIDSSNTAAYGSGNIANDGRGQVSLGNTGVYEFVRATNSVPLSGGTLTFVGGSANDGTINGYVNADPTATRGRRTFQVIRMVQYASLSLTSDITVPDWNGQVGGVLGLDIAGDMNFNGFTIDGTARGFRGGFIPNDPSNTSGANRNDYVLPGDSTEGSGKGEGIAGTPRYMWDGVNAIDLGSDQLPGGDAGRGAPGNSGGGGNAHNAGGGGGANGGDGGIGGIGWEGANGDLLGSRGLGGTVPVSMPVGDRLIMGGGGGGGDVNNDPDGIRGGQGGGIVFIRADRFVGSGTIVSNGSDGEEGDVNGAPDGAGGGGAGGTVALIAKSGNFSGLDVDARGGAGGNSNDANSVPHGPGGGGGGGLVVSDSPGGQVPTPDLAGGVSGRTELGAGDPHGAGDGVQGVAGTLNPAAVPPAQQGADCFPSLTVTKTEANPGTPGGRSAPNSATYTITTTNAGPGGATGVQISDVLPSGFTYSSGAAATFSGGASGPAAPANSGSASAPIFGAYTIPEGGSVSVTFTADIAPGTALGTYQNPAYVSYLDPARTTDRRISPSAGALPGANTTYDGGSQAGQPTPGSNYVATSSTGEDVVIVASPPEPPPAGACEVLLVNGSFEVPAVNQTPPTPAEVFETNTIAAYDEDDVPGWFSSADDFIELWRTGNTIAGSALEDEQFAEINAYVEGSLFQDVATTPGSILTWQFAHRGRTGVDTLNLRIGPLGSEVAQINSTTGTTSFSTGNSDWVQYQGTYTVPAGQTTTRFEYVAVSTANGNESTGNFIDAVRFGPLCDHGDADASYPVIRADGGAAHVNDGVTFLGSGFGVDLDGQPSTAADGDDGIAGDGDGFDDEDGVTFTSGLTAGDTGTLEVVASVAAPLSAWIDFNADGDWDDADEQVLVDQPLSAGVNSLSFAIPPGATAGNTYARFRLSAQAGLLPTGIVGGGEVEDYLVEIAPPVASNPSVLLNKRITAINRGRAVGEQLFDNYYVDVDTPNDNVVNWPGGAVPETIGSGTVESYITGITGVDSSTAAFDVTTQPGDELEYTISFLSNGDAVAQDVLICDRIPANTTFILDAFNGATPATPGAGDRGILLSLGGNDVALTNASDGDELAATGGNNNAVGGYYFPATVEPSTVFGANVDCGGSNTNGAVVVDLSNLLPATGDGVPTESYGYFRFRAVVE
ncbi:MAG: DUF11 domain-containing protein [Cyanobacteria bacterium J06634_6]